MQPASPPDKEVNLSGSDGSEENIPQAQPIMAEQKGEETIERAVEILAPSLQIDTDPPLGQSSGHSSDHSLGAIPAGHRAQPNRLGLGLVAGIAFAAIAALVLWLSPIGGAINAIPQKPKVAIGLEHIKNFTRKDAIPEAQVLFASMLADDPDHAGARAGLAMALMREYTHLERDPALLRRAKSSAQAALRADPNLALANIAAGWAAEFDGEFEQAHKHYDRADILDPDNVFTLEGRARTYNKQGRREEAEKTLEYGYTLHPDYVLFYSYRSELYVIQDDYSNAEKMFRQVIAKSNDNQRTYSQLAHALHYQDQTDEAIKVLQEGLKLNKAARLYNYLGARLINLS